MTTLIAPRNPSLAALESAVTAALDIAGVCPRCTFDAVVVPLALRTVGVDPAERDAALGRWRDRVGGHTGHGRRRFAPTSR
ncbi:hypothetical protein [Rhodococcus sp. B50]|uniref:hypothetical protein n=1 Tax=Rhodococcus sp. B50 TaxID=2682847 RepID=UPI001BD1EF90|nr:hypothetical protein [Rhodococcus sp. B50]MBS9373618.1 hypothetical protein [Rhodococcus sp. B50]